LNAGTAARQHVVQHGAAGTTLSMLEGLLDLAHAILSDGRASVE